MRHSPIAMYPATAALCALLDGPLGRPVETLSLEQIQAERGKVYPDRPPVSWVTGGGRPRTSPPR